jgi:isocitrate/isopropylmalate dehydrogenase
VNASTYRVAVIGGDGIGPEVTAAAQRVVETAGADSFSVEWLPVVRS